MRYMGLLLILIISVNYSMERKNRCCYFFRAICAGVLVFGGNALCLDAQMRELRDSSSSSVIMERMGGLFMSFCGIPFVPRNEDEVAHEHCN